MAAVKKRYGTSRKQIHQDLQTAEDVQEKLEGFWLVLQQYRYPILGGLGALFAVVSAVSFMQHMTETTALENNARFTSVVDVMNTPVIPASDVTEGAEKSFPTEAARGEATLAEVDTFTKGGESGDMAGFASLATANAQFEMGAWADSLATASEWNGAHANSSLSNAMILRAAITAKASGDTAAAKGFFTQATESPETWFQIQGLMGLGDLSNQALGGSEANADAQSQYEKCLALVEQVPAGATRDALRDQVQGRLDSL